MGTKYLPTKKDHAASQRFHAQQLRDARPKKGAKPLSAKPAPTTKAGKAR